MKVICHRGYWSSREEQNTLIALKTALSNGFGVETDLRDQSGEVVVSHDPAINVDLSLDDLLSFYKNYDRSDTPLALNIKADGLQENISYLLKKHRVKNYFVFDASLPDLYQYQEKKIRFFSRQSDLEKEIQLYPKSAGVWADSFINESWLLGNKLPRVFMDNKELCIVSPELHKRPHIAVWRQLKETFKKLDNCMICTDYPCEADEFFNKK